MLSIFICGCWPWLLYGGSHDATIKCRSQLIFCL